MYNLTNDEEQKEVLKNGADAQMMSLTENCENKVDGEGLLNHVAYAVPQELGIDTSTIFGDYFYMEALMRKINPDWKRYW